MKHLLYILLVLTGLSFSDHLFAGEEPAPPVKGTVLTADGQPAAAVTIRVKSNGRTTITNDDGTFALYNLPAGEYDLEISLTVFQPITEHITVQPRHTTTVNIHLQVSEKQL